MNDLPFDKPYRRPFVGLLCLGALSVILFAAITQHMHGWMDGILHDFRVELGAKYELGAKLILYFVLVFGAPMLVLMAKHCFFPSKPRDDGLLKIR